MAGLMAPFSRRQHDRPEHGDLKLFVEQILDLLETTAAQDGDAAAQQFHRQVGQFRAQITAAPEGHDLARAGTACVEACRQFFAARRSQDTEREAGYRGMIQVLTEGLATVATEAGSFTAQLTTASERVTSLTKVDDIRVLKQRLTQEVGEIKRVVVEKQQRDQALHVRLTQRVSTLETSLVQTQVAAALDPLTRVANRGHFEATLSQWVESHRRSAGSFVLMMIDTDDFKSINDTHGHPAGDKVLIAAAQTFARMVRPCDLVSRYGGDEFALLLDNMTLEQAEKRAAEMVARVAQTEFTGDNPGAEPASRLTISCGVAQFGRHDTAESLIKRADEALYAAKGQGRNCAVAKRSSFWQSG